MKVRSALMAAGLLIFSASNARAALINFDDVFGGSSGSGPTDISTYYQASLGVTFACVDGASPGICTSWDSDGSAIWARANGTNNSGPNVVSTLRTGIPAERTNLTGTIQASFATGQTSVSIDAYTFLSPEGFGSPGMGFLTAYNNTLGALGTISTTAVGTWQTLTLSGFTSTIDYVQFSGAIGQHASYSFFDNLNFNTSTGGGGTDPGPISTPEPASAVLLGGALLGLAAGRRRLSR